MPNDNLDEEQQDKAPDYQTSIAEDALNELVMSR
jgi:hypothetical protein